jgi:hypothetical protein
MEYDANASLDDRVVITSHSILVSLDETKRRQLHECVQKGTISIQFDSIPLNRLPNFRGDGVQID